LHKRREPCYPHVLAVRARPLRELQHLQVFSSRLLTALLPFFFAYLAALMTMNYIPEPSLALPRALFG
jgi:hypothetical protein